MQENMMLVGRKKEINRGVNRKTECFYGSENVSKKFTKSLNPNADTYRPLKSNYNTNYVDKMQDWFINPINYKNLNTRYDLPLDVTLNNYENYQYKRSKNVNKMYEPFINKQTTMHSEIFENLKIIHFPCTFNYESKELDINDENDSYELILLKLERLALEEKRILKEKTMDELERTRGPTKKWYELKNKNFSTEIGKNNLLIKNLPQLNDLLKYRKQLLKSKSLYI
ncbi:hypothetical protein A3Q56_05618 [Intoshia linei]|uniref:Uncharacterized protein n=1 Tax=Intoshia linei TaxID=1819745 RepID=A0A177AXE6_9BILA|nr:hypothetical protein A3Q56_05618 [Intoshia linei]